MHIVTPGKKQARRRSGASTRQEKPARRISRALLWKVLLLVPVAGIAGFAAMETPKVVETVSKQRVEQVIIEGDIHFVSEQEVLAAVNSYISESLLLVDMQNIKEELERMPWVRSVTIRRQWPDTMVLSVAEEKAIARWDSNKLLNQDGAIFAPDSITGQEHLAILSGPVGSERGVMEQYLLFNQLLYPRGLKIAELELSERGAWKLMLTNGVAVNVGKIEVMQRMRRLVEFTDPAFIDQMSRIESIDLRYTSGIAVKNKPINAEEVVSL